MKYKILIINWQDITHPLGGGAEVHMHEIFKRIAAKGHHVTLLCSKFKHSKSAEIIDGIKVIRTGARNFFNFVVPSAYNRLDKKENFDIIIDDINKIPFYTPLFVRKPVIGIIHHLFGASIFLEAPLPIALYVHLTERFVPKIYKNVPIAVVSESTKNELIRKKLRKQNLHIIYNGVDCAAYRYIPSKKSPTPLIGYLGRIKKYKSVDHLLISFSKVIQAKPNVQLIIMGDGDNLNELKKLSSSLHLDHAVQFLGSTQQTDKVNYLNTVWFTVNPSPKEGWGLTVIESNACGIPVIAADSPGLRDSVVNNKTGLLYPYGNCYKLAKKMIELITDEKLRLQLSRNCLSWSRKFDWNISAEKMIQLIETTLREK